MGILVGKEAARANTAIYALYVDSGLQQRNAAETRKADKNPGSLERDSTVLGRWLEQFSGAAGGTLFRVQAGTGESAFDRILSETSSYYLLGVEPAEADRDGRVHEIKVKTNQRNVTVRGRKWVAVPKRGASVAEAAPIAKPSEPASSPAPSKVPAARVVPREVQALADLFDRGDYQALQRGLGQTRDLANLIRDFRTSDSPWPDAPHRAAVFALEMAVAGLRSDNKYARDEGGRLLVEYNTRLRQPLAADPFECSWLWAEVAALEGLFTPDSAMLFVPRALERCPNDPRLHLALAMVTEQQWVRGAPGASDELEVTHRYEAAMRFPETEGEARVRAAWFLHRTGKSDRALSLLADASGRSTDRQVRYFADLVRGQVLRALGRFDDAAAAFDAALTTWPGAQSARVALMTLLVSRGDRERSVALAQATETAPDDQFDPWWTYWLGDFRAYPAIIAGLRELAR
jgi:tetratricopeptide (TPR) repeat protein